MLGEASSAQAQVFASDVIVAEREEAPMSIVGGVDVRYEALVFRMGV